MDVLKVYHIYIHLVGIVCLKQKHVTYCRLVCHLRVDKLNLKRKESQVKIEI